MARQISVRITCDPCSVLDAPLEPDVDAEELPPIAIGVAKGKVVAMCKQHREELYDPFAEIIARWGATPDKLNGAIPAAKPRTPGAPAPSVSPESSTGKRLVCPIAGCDSPPLKNASSVASHLRRTHSSNLYDTIGPDGQLYDVDGDPVETPKVRRYATSRR